MGLFGSKKTYVSSTLYNMAGPEKDRTNFLKTTVVGNVITDSKRDFANILSDAYLHGPGLRLRSFYRWAEDNYPIVGAVRSTTGVAKTQNNSVLEQQIPHASDQDIRVQTYEMSVADFSYWAEQRILELYPERIQTDWSSDFDDATGEVVITYADGTKERFIPAEFNRNSLYIYATYFLTNAGSVGAIVPGETVHLGTSGTMPDTTGWAEQSNSSTPQSYTLHKITKTTVSYSDNRPNEETTVDEPSDATRPDTDVLFTKTVYDGSTTGSVDGIGSTKYSMHQFGSYKIETDETTTTTTEDVAGVTKTTTQVIKTDKLVADRSYRVDQQKIVNKTWSNAKMFIYRFNTGNNALDAIFQVTDDAGQYVPYIPVRLDNKFINEIGNTPAYEQAKKAYKKALNGGKLEDMIDKLKENSSLKDIDYAYVMFGVPLNVLENSSRKYLFLFFDNLRERSKVSPTEQALYEQQRAAYSADSSDWFQWKSGQNNPANPYYGAPEPTVSQLPVTPENAIRIKSNGTLNTNMDIRISWQSIKKTTGTGLKKPEAKKGDVWLTLTDVEPVEDKFYNKGLFFNLTNSFSSSFFINYQVDEDHWETLQIDNLKHENYIYNGKFVLTTARDAWNDSDESGFLVPLHYPTVRQMSLVESTQMMTAAAYMVFNSYQVVKTKWYQTGIFKIITFAIVIAITVATGGVGAIGAGVLGSAASVGAAIGLTGLVGIIVGAVANALAAMIIMKIISTVSVTLLGDKLGAIIGAIAATAAVAVGTSMAVGNIDISTALQSMTKPENLIKLSEATSNGIASAVASSTNNIMQKTTELLEDYKKQSKEISQRFMDEFGYDKGGIDPLSLTDLGKMTIETEDQFLARTLITGEDIAQMTNNLISQFAEIGVSTKLPI